MRGDKFRGVVEGEHDSYFRLRNRTGNPGKEWSEDTSRMVSESHPELLDSGP